jgi:putative acetyltransferase
MVETNRSFRWASAGDYDQLADIMFDAVRNGESRYTERQRQAWVPVRRAGSDWVDRLQGQQIIVAEQEGEAVGFMSLTAVGYIDFAYIRPQAQHSGLFRQLLSHIIERAVATRVPVLWTHASLMAEPAFKSLGFIVRRREQVAVGPETFERCEMERRLQTKLRL